MEARQTLRQATKLWQEAFHHWWAGTGLKQRQLDFQVETRARVEGEGGAVPVGTGTAPVPADQAALTSIVRVNRPGRLQAIAFIEPIDCEPASTPHH